MARALFGAVVVASIGWILAGGLLNPTAAVNEGMIRMAGGLLGAIAGAVIGGAADVVAAIRQDRSPGPPGPPR